MAAQFRYALLVFFILPTSILAFEPPFTVVRVKVSKDASFPANSSGQTVNFALTGPVEFAEAGDIRLRGATIIASTQESNDGTLTFKTIELKASCSGGDSKSWELTGYFNKSDNSKFLPAKVEGNIVKINSGTDGYFQLHTYGEEAKLVSELKQFGCIDDAT